MVSPDRALFSSLKIHLLEDHKVIRDETFNILIAGRDTVHLKYSEVWALTDNTFS